MLGVIPSVGRGGIGSRLVESFLESAADLGAERVILTTDAHGNDGVNTFYQRLGFKCQRAFEVRPGRILNEYTKTIKDR